MEEKWKGGGEEVEGPHFDKKCVCVGGGGGGEGFIFQYLHTVTYYAAPVGVAMVHSHGTNTAGKTE